MTEPSVTYHFTKTEAAALYALLRKQESLSRSLSYFYHQLEQFVFAELTIEELENLDDLIHKGLL